jgi:hypothetical protein
VTALHIRRARVPLTLAVCLIATLHIAWEYASGGIRQHHVLNQSDLPAISNIWNLLILPALAWIVSGLVYRSAQRHADDQNASRVVRTAVRVCAFAFISGAALAGTFELGLEDLTFYILIGILCVGLLFPVGKPEFVLGFVIAMFVTFGATLPLVIGSVIAGISAGANWLKRQLSHLAPALLTRIKRNG